MDYVRAASFWIEKDKNAVKMPEQKCKVEIETFINAHSTCTLAVADGDFIRCTPLTYKYRMGKFYIFSEGGLKFRALAQNKNIALAIYDEYKGPGSAKSLQVTGSAQVIGSDDADYVPQLTAAHMNAAHMQSLGLILILITPHVMEYLNASLKDQGFSLRQTLHCPRPC